MRFPIYRQLDAMDCGPTCLRMIAKFYGKNYSLQTLRTKCHITREGVSMLGISDAAELIGFRTEGVKLTWEQLRDNIPFPLIVHWKQRHFVVVYNIKKNRQSSQKDDYWVYVADPAGGLLKYNKEDFLKCWYSTREDNLTVGTALIIEPSPRFYEEKDDSTKKSILRIGYMMNYLRPYTKFIVQFFLAMLTGSMISLIFPFLTQGVVDYGINNSDLGFIVTILIAQVALTLGQTANGLIQSWLSLHVTTRISIAFISDFLAKLMRLPISFFDVKMVGDIMQRIGDNSRIQSFLMGTLLNIIFSCFTFVVYGAIMTTYNLTILGIFLLGSALYAGWVVVFLKKRKELDYKRFQQGADNQSSLVQLINGMQEIKLNSCEKQKRWEWERIQAKMFRISIKSMALGQTQQVGGLFIDQTKNVLVSFIAAKAVVEGDMTLGMMMAMQYILGQLNGPISQFIGFIQAAQDAKISAERLNEIHDMEDEEPEDKEKIREIPANADLELKNVTFQYEGPHSAKVLDDVSLKIPAGKVTAIVGVSGSGKTTLLKLLLGFYKPVSGSISLNNIALDRYSDSCWRRNCGVVMQEGYIFSDTLENNIGVIDETPDYDRVEHAVKVANVEDFVEGLPLRYNTKIGVDGHGLSTGQKQRLFIARAVYKNPKCIFFDEATNSLDANNEKAIMDNMKTFFEGRTVVVVAHRLSTVKNADTIVVLHKGQIVEQGTHSELIAAKGAYYDLVKDQLELGN
ncbi:peptidase domain-containing ABC transporter [Alistipes hominis]|uniref:Peptidase domain-containing ABC transporter n=1 Tax=Alistipes hominis TaxID=2763015 RepID=A0ABR7CPF8_9BACT|nr:peptidase domain-containing ABC transporter [Alistipes hominis]MBC5617561.1 peptidase domain-containing ABC transporter [Alistipes hominis]